MQTLSAKQLALAGGGLYPIFWRWPTRRARIIYTLISVHRLDADDDPPIIPLRHTGGAH